MSPRATKRQRSRMPHMLAWLVACLLVLLLTVVLLPGPLLQRLLASPKAKTAAEEAIVTATGIDGRFASWRRSGETIFSTRFRGSGSGIRLEADDIRGSVRIEGWPGGTLRVDSLTIRNAQVLIDPGTESAAPSSVKVPPPWWLRALLPANFAMSTATIERAAVEYPGVFSLHDFRAAFAPEGRGLRIQATQGSLVSSLPGSWLAKSLDILLIDDEVRLISSSFILEETQGTASLSGTWSRHHASRASIDIQSAPLAILAPQLSEHVSGELEARLHASRPAQRPNTSWNLDGDVALVAARVTDLTPLDSLATLANDPSLKTLTLDTAKARVHTSQDGIRLENIVIEARGTLRVEGRVDLRANRSIEGALNLGLAPSLLNKLPGAARLVFTTARAGYLWTPVRISGTADSPKTDLPARLAAALPADLILQSAETATRPIDAAEAAAESTQSIIHDVGKTLFDLIQTR